MLYCENISSAALVDSISPLCLISHRSVVTSGKNATQCFDRFEVAEHTAKFIVNSYSICGGKMEILDDDELSVIEKEFHLPPARKQEHLILK